MDVQQRRLGRRDALSQRCVDVLDVVQPLRALKIDDQMRASAMHAIADAKVICGFLHRGGARLRLPAEGTGRFQALSRSQKRVLPHGNPF
jgi:hypothetical protein